MICGFIQKDYSISYKELSKEQIENLCEGEQYFSINANSEYYIFTDNEIYAEENMDRIMPLLMKINKELLIKNGCVS